MGFVKTNWWKSSYKLPASFIIFFVLAFFLIGEQLPALPLYLGIDKGAGAKIHILDTAATDALHHPLVYFLIAGVNWLLLSRFNWLVVWLVGGVLAILEQLYVNPPDHRPHLSGSLAWIGYIATVLFAWGVFTLIPYFAYRAIDRKWGKVGIRNSIIILFVINLLLFGFFAYQIFVRHNSHRSYPGERSIQSNPRSNNSNSNDQQSSSSGMIAEKSLITPFFKESDIVSINEAFSTTSNSGWGFEHGGIDFMTGQDFIPFRAATDGIVESAQLYQLESTHNWQVGVTIIHGESALIYGFETFSSDKNAGEVQLKNIAVQIGQKLQQGDLIGRLHKAGNGAHVHFGVVLSGRDASGQKCPEPYFTDDAKETILRIIHKDHPDWRMCYE